MIKEEYCNNEVSELLKENGFDWETEHKYWNPHKKIEVKRPTMQMAMRWLREVYYIGIGVYPFVIANGYWTNKWCCHTGNLKEKYPFSKYVGVFSSYEEAVEAALKYSLENLVKEGEK